MRKNGQGINVLSLFDGISCGQIALERAGINKVKYMASEIKPWAINLTTTKWPNTQEIGDVLKIHLDKTTRKLYSNCGRVVIACLGNKVDGLDKHKDKQEWTKDEIENFEKNGMKVLNNGDVLKYSWTKQETLDFIAKGYELAPSGEVIDWDTSIGNLIHDSEEEGCIDLLIGGSPCQDFSTAGAFSGKVKNGEYGLNGLKSRLFYEYLRIMKEIQNARKDNEKPLIFFLENVKMQKPSEKALNEYMGVEGIHINSNLLSFQHRDRIYWTNIYEITGQPFVMPEDKNYNFQDFKELPQHGEDAKKRLAEALLADTISRRKMWDDGNHKYKFSCKNITNEPKVSCLTTKQDRCPNSGLIAIDVNDVIDYLPDNKKRMNCRFITKREVELAQTYEPGYLDSLSYLQAQNVAGDGWTADVIAYFFKDLPKEFKEGFELPKDKKPWNLDDYKVNNK